MPIRKQVGDIRVGFEFSRLVLRQSPFVCATVEFLDPMRIALGEVEFDNTLGKRLGHPARGQVKNSPQNICVRLCAEPRWLISISV